MVQRIAVALTLITHLGSFADGSSTDTIPSIGVLISSADAQDFPSLSNIIVVNALLLPTARALRRLGIQLSFSDDFCTVCVGAPSFVARNHLRWMAVNSALWLDDICGDRKELICGDSERLTRLSTSSRNRSFRTFGERGNDDEWLSPLSLPHHPHPPTPLCLSLTTHTLSLPSASPSPPTPSHSPLPLPHHPHPPTPLCLSLTTHTLPLPSASPSPSTPSHSPSPSPHSAWCMLMSVSSSH
ncbi:hypothetical protein BLNAU_8925 [Blattamonas nauphoetae]|uniref:Uncharacterized protein n=1 Tax=Blattamonas nauphoetae TaxID=2049346 RepID=A0ABQ9XXD2_9EUKA|nr:hypothetical protein BLNAU_8925 [Blattamonas nauphoetae]